MKLMPQVSRPVEMKLAADVALELIGKTNVETEYEKQENLAIWWRKFPRPNFSVCILSRQAPASLYMVIGCSFCTSTANAL